MKSIISIFLSASLAIAESDGEDQTQESCQYHNAVEEIAEHPEPEVREVLQLSVEGAISRHSLWPQSAVTLSLHKLQRPARKEEVKRLHHWETRTCRDELI